MTSHLGSHWARLWLLVAIANASVACATLPKNQYGVDTVRFRGVDQMSSQALESCLATKERDGVKVKLGLGGSSCGKPPFDANTPEISLWTWPWSTWPVYDPAIFEIDRKRILRWYQARGFYQAKVVGVRYQAGDKALEAPEQCKDSDCKLEIEIEVSEGQPVEIKSVVVSGDEALDRRLRIDLRKTPHVEPGQRFDESSYEEDKQLLVKLLQEHAYAQAQVTGKIEIDRNERLARVDYVVEPGPLSTFGGMRVEGNAHVDPQAIIEVAGIKPGSQFKPSVLTDAERAVHALGLFSSVRIETHPRTDNSGVVDLVCKLSLGRLERWRFGVGMLSGTMQRGSSDETFSIPEWDIHLRAAYSHEDFLGGMRKLKLEERPRLIMLDQFPAVPKVGPQVGNTLTANFEQPRFIEPRTVFFIDGQWDYGPAPFLADCNVMPNPNMVAPPECVVFRHDLQTKLGLRRKFWGHRISVQLAVAHDLYEIIGQAPETVSDYRLPYLEQQVRFDVRNDAQRPSKGFYLDNTVQEAFRPAGYGSWNYVRWLPEARAYQRLLWRIVLAERFAFGAIFIDEGRSDQKLDPTSLHVGPESYRLRGGGANSNRGFGAGELGVGKDGGTRRWEGSVELRIPLGESVGLTAFFDVGDVNDKPRVRWRRLNAATGLGLRYFTPFAPIRFDAGWRIPGLEAVGGEPPPAGPPTEACRECKDQKPAQLKLVPSAMHLTIGEAF